MKIAVASGKGGTGKTTVAVNLAHLASEAGKTVHLMDCDVEEPNCHIFVNPEFETATEIVRVRTAWSVDGARPGAQVVLAIVVDIEEGYHINPDVSQLTSLKDLL